jgi:hypothetical protein
VVGIPADRHTFARSTRTQPRCAPIVPVRPGAGVTIDGDVLSPSVYATLKHAASMPNPEFYDKQRRRQSTWNTPRFIGSYDETLDGNDQEFTFTAALSLRQHEALGALSVAP